MHYSNTDSSGSPPSLLGGSDDWRSREPPTNPIIRRRPIRFRMMHLLYAVTLAGASLSLFGVWGTVPAIVILAFWAFVFSSPSPPRALFQSAMLLSATLLIGRCMAPVVYSTRNGGIRRHCAINLKQIAIGLQNYHDINGTFPPAYIADKNGEPQHSWRVLLLPFIEEQTLYDQYSFNEPWDGPNNRCLLNRRPHIYACPTHLGRGRGLSTHTNYVAVKGPDTAWPGSTSRKLADFKLSAADTVQVFEHSESVPWLAPHDTDWETVLHLATTPFSEIEHGHRYEDFFYFRYDSGRHVALADGSIRYVYHGLDREVWRRLLSIKEVDARQQIHDGIRKTTPRRPKLVNWFRLGAFVFVTLLPLPWVWRNPRGVGNTDVESAKS